MKKLLIICGLLLGMTSAQAQEWNEWNKKNIFEHVGIGVGVGFSGITIDLGTDVTDYLTIRGGMDIFPKIKADFDVNTGFESSLSGNVPSGYNIPKDKITITGKTSLGAGHLLFDIHPFKTAFRITTGFYFASDKIITIENKDDADLLGVAQWNADVYPTVNTSKPGLAALASLNGGSLPRVGIEMGDYFLAPDNNGHVDAFIKVNSVRPYVGLGFGRMVPKNTRLTCNVDLGVQFWGTPKIYLNGIDGEKELDKADIEDGDGSKALDIMSKITVYPQLTVRLVGRIF